MGWRNRLYLFVEQWLAHIGKWLPSKEATASFIDEENETQIR
jgi:hypothetical protein